MKKTPDINPFDGKPLPQTQAQRVIAKFGGAYKLAQALNRLEPEKRRDPSNVFRWTYPRTKGGTGGMIPAGAMLDVLDAAKSEGILLTPDDFYPGKLVVR